MKVVDNFLPRSYHRGLLELMSGPDFPWHFNPNIAYKDQDGGSLYEHGFTNIFWDELNGFRDGNEYGNFWRPGLLSIMDFISEEYNLMAVEQFDYQNPVLRSRADMTIEAPILRSKANLLTATSDNFTHAVHKDFEFDNIATIYYVNDSDGDTIMYGPNGEISDRVSPKANRLIIFKGNQPHTGCSPNKTKSRILINSNFATEVL
jgi:hypothetical protein